MNVCCNKGTLQFKTCLTYRYSNNIIHKYKTIICFKVENKLIKLIILVQKFIIKEVSFIIYKDF